MDAAGHEEDVEVLGVGAADVGGDAVADAEDAPAVDGAPQPPLGLGDAEVVDGGVRLARHADLAAQVGVELGQGPGAGDQPVAPLHHDVGVGAEQGQATGEDGLEALAVVLGGLGLVVVGAGDADDGGVLRSGQVQAEAGVEGGVPVWPDGPDGPRRALGQQGAGGVARGDHGVPGRAGHAQGVQLGNHVGGGPRGVGDQDDRPPALGEGGQGPAGGGEALAAIVDDAPDVGQDHVVAVGDLVQALDRRGKAHDPGR